MLYDFFDELYRLNREVNKYLGTSKRRGVYGGYWPEVNVYENQDEYVAVARVPGFKKEEVNLSFKDNALKISGERKVGTDEKNYHLKERKYGKFERNFLLDEKIDTNNVEAEMKDGLLIIKLPKSPETKPVSIAIK